MRRRSLLWLIPLSVILIMVAVVQLVASRAERARLQVDLEMMITMPDGGVLPLREVLAPIESRSAASEAQLAAPSGAPEALRRDGEPGEEVADAAIEARSAGVAQPITLCDLAEQRLRGGDIAQAKALYASVAPGDADYGLAQRRLGWEIQTRFEGDPLAGVGSVNRSLRANPLDGNAWQDASRVYLESVASIFH